MRLVVGILPVVALLAQPVEVSAQQTGAELYMAACAACHGDGGMGVPASTLGFDTPVPDFSDCSFASREPDGDWLWVVHEGGPVRAFDRMMPAFGDALSEDETLRILRHIRVFCEDPTWPRGELNLPRPLATEKAFPEDEYVLTLSRDGGEAGEITSEFLYEKRFGSRNQIEVLLPFRFGQPSGDWNGGVGDMAFAYKRVLFHSLESGSIFSVAGEVVVPTGDRDRGLGDGVTVFEPFVAFGQILPRDSFLHFQAGFELPSGGELPREVFWRTALGTTFAQNGFGRAWSPMIEILAARTLGEGGTTHWDAIPQIQLSLSTRQHVLLNAGVRVPVGEADGRSSRVLVYLLWDWFDGGFFDGW